MRMRYWIAIVSALAAGLVAEPGSARAEENWADSRSGNDGDVGQKAAQDEAKRAERRKSYKPVVYPKFMNGGDRPNIAPAEPPIVYFDRAEEVGSIIVDTQSHKLYFVLPGKKAYEYPISVGREGFTWSGTERITRIASWPSWTPPPEMHKRQPGLPITVSGGLINPQGARALYLGNTSYRIHGTNNERTVGRANSSGCFRLTNEHVVHLATIAKVGTKVRVLQAYTGDVSQNAPLSSLFGSDASDRQPTMSTKARRKLPNSKRAAASTEKESAGTEKKAAE